MLKKLEALQNWMLDFHPFDSCPWKDKEFNYLNGNWIVVRTPFCPDLKANPIPSEFVERLYSMFKKTISPVITITDIRVPSFFAACPSCNGSGKTKYVECPECEGAGIIAWETNFNEYEDTCATCYGTGKVSLEKVIKLYGQSLRLAKVSEVCTECNGTGKIPNPEPVQIGDYHLQSFIINKLVLLPNFKIAKKLNEFNAAYFQFEGGDGFVMPIKV